MRKDPFILYIEDEEDFQILVGRILGRAGFEVKTCATLAEGLEALERRRPDLLLLDINLPDGDGYAACRRLREDPAFVDLPVLMLTVRRRPDEWLRGFSSGATDYISKPINPPELIERITDALADPRRKLPDPSNPEYRLIRAAVAGNRRAFEVLIERYRPRLTQGILQCARHDQQAEDVVSRTFVLAYEKMAQFRGESSFYTWLYRIALYELAREKEDAPAVSLDLLCEEGKGALPGVLMDRDPDTPDWEKEQLLARAHERLAQVPDPYRRVLQLFFLKDFSYERIARQLKIPMGTVMSRMHKGRRLMTGTWRPRSALPTSQ